MHLDELKSEFDSCTITVQSQRKPNAELDMTALLLYTDLEHYISSLTAALSLSVRRVRTSSGCDLRLPLVTIGQQLLLVVEELLSCLGGVLGVRACIPVSGLSL